ncbi:MAG TPA: cation transporter [candidate division Zixibacteria bacterium]|nr:cation transporter [candidate division Zixibacteria bacterium]
MSEKRDISQIRRITWIGIGVNLALATVKFAVGILGNSQAVIADAFHSISDVSTDFAVIFGVKFWSAPPDECHPFGHKRIETIIATAIGLALAAVAVALGYRAITTFGTIGDKPTGWIAAIGPLVSIALKEVLFRRTKIVGEKSRSRAVIANAWHHRSDALSSIPALLAVVIASIRPSWAFVDNIASGIIAVFILKVSWDIVRPSIAELTERAAPESERLAIERIAFSVHGVREVHAIRTRKLGDNIHVDLHILVDAEITVYEGHEISEAVKSAIIISGPNVADVVVHIEPFTPENRVR